MAMQAAKVVYKDETKETPRRRLRLVNSMSQQNALSKVFLKHGVRKKFIAESIGVNLDTFYNYERRGFPVETANKLEQVIQELGKTLQEFNEYPDIEWLTVNCGVKKTTSASLMGLSRQALYMFEASGDGIPEAHLVRALRALKEMGAQLAKFKMPEKLIKAS